MSLAADTVSETKHPDEVRVPDITGSRLFVWALVATVAVGVIARVLFVAGWTWGTPLHGDPLYFQQSAAHIANGRGYVDRFLGKGHLVPTAVHPPALSFLLAGLDLIHIRSVDAHRLGLALVSAIGVLAMGLLGRRVAGPGVGLFAAGIAALDPLWVQWGGFLMSESLYLVIVPTMLLFALRCLDRPNRWDCLALGLLIGLATLTRSEAVDFVLLLGIVVLVLATRVWRERMVFALVFLVGVGSHCQPTGG
jgi:4-amino-4-deoxy-L-arabinose transferase-like glycosyltransferase